MASKLPRYTRFSGRLAGMAAKPVWVCANLKCEMHSNGEVDSAGKRKEPKQCLSCGGMVFDRFPTRAEADRWAQLRLQEKGGLISNLRRQVRYPLYTVDSSGLKVEVAVYVADFVWQERDGRVIIQDEKPRKGVDALAALKLKWMAAQGTPVTIHSM